MDIHELRQFESVYKPSKEVAFCWLRKQYVQLSTEENHTEIVDHANDSLRIWQAAKAQAMPEGFVLVEKDLIQSIHQSCNNALDINDRDIYKGLCMAIIDDAEAMIEAQEPTND